MNPLDIATNKFVSDTKPDMHGDRDHDSNAPFFGLQNGLDSKVIYPQKFVYPQKKNLPRGNM